jgi:D-alanyl-D-alanine carboxypeptidase
MLIICSHGLHAQDSAAFTASPELQPFDISLVTNLVPDDGEIRAGLLYDVNRKCIVWQKDMDYAWPIASLTKMMVGLIAVEDVEKGAVCMDDTITVENYYKKRIKRRKYRTYKVTERYLMSDLLKMAMIRSHNESTVWIAKHCSGSVEAFVERMNKKAAELKMTKTFYSNTSGLPSPGVDNSASPRDLLTLALECMKHEQLMQITAMPSATVSTGRSKITYRNHNGLTINYTGEVDGIKTGYTKAAGFCLVATTGRADHRLISVVLGVRSPWVRNGIVAGMVNSYYDAIRLGRLGEAQPEREPYLAFLDSLSLGLAAITPKTDGHVNNTDDAYAYTYKTVTERVKKYYSVRSGDNLSKIADKLNCSVTDLKKWNRLKSTRVMKGQRLLSYVNVKKRIPVKLEVIPCEDNIADADSCVNADVKSIAAAKPEQKEVKKSQPVQETYQATKAKIVYHMVQPGDTLWNIAQRYRTTIQEIRKVNKISGNQIKIGVKIKVPVSA